MTNDNVSSTSLDQFNQSGPPVATDQESPSDSDEYGTPRDLIRTLIAALGGLFALDPAAGAEPMPIAEERFTEADDGLSQSWLRYDSIYLNPPYSNPEPWLRKLAAQFLGTGPNEGPEFALALTKTDTSTNWFHEHLLYGDLFCFPDGRLSFHGAADDADFPNMFTVFGSPPEALLDALDSMGALCAPVEVETALEQQRLSELVSDGGIAAVEVPLGEPTIDGPADQEDASLCVFHPGDDLTIHFARDGYGARSLPPSVSVSVLPDGKEVDPETGAVTLQTIGHTPDGTQVCVALRSAPSFTTGLEVSIAVDDAHWQLATPTAIVPESPGIEAGQQFAAGL